MNEIKVMMGKRCCRTCGTIMDDDMKYCPRCNKKQYSTVSDWLIGIFLVSNLIGGIVAILVMVPQ